MNLHLGGGGKGGAGRSYCIFSALRDGISPIVIFVILIYVEHRSTNTNEKLPKFEVILLQNNSLKCQIKNWNDTEMLQRNLNKCMKH